MSDPGGAIVRRVYDGPGDQVGRVEVVEAGPVIMIAREIWDEMGWTLDEPFAIDTAGEYRYRYLRPARDGYDSVIAGRVQ